jgi:CDP-diacylglycerol pyrophosphatase
MALKGCIVAKSVTGRPFPCLSVEPDKADRPGTAVMRAPGSPSHVIVMPVRDIVGIEAPELRHQIGNILWRESLASRRHVVEALNGAITIDDVGIAVNAEGGRSQDHLHIHLDCLGRSVHTAVLTSAQHINGDWTLLPHKLQGSRFFAMRTKAVDAERFNPFDAVQTLPSRGSRPNEITFVAISTGPDDPDRGHLLLAFRAPGGHSEKLLDHACLIAQAGQNLHRYR